MRTHVSEKQNRALAVLLRTSNNRLTVDEIQEKVDGFTVQDAFALEHTPYVILGGDISNNTNITIRLTQDGISHAEQYLHEKKMTFWEWQRLYLAWIAIVISVISLTLSIYSLFSKSQW